MATIRIPRQESTEIARDPTKTGEVGQALLGADGWKAIRRLLEMIARGAVVRGRFEDNWGIYEPDKCTDADAHEQYRGLLDAMGAWCHRLGEEELAKRWAGDAAAGKLDRARGVGARLTRVWMERAWPESPASYDTSKQTHEMQSIIDGVRELVSYQLYLLDDMLPGYSVEEPKTRFTFDLAEELAEEMGHSDVATVLSAMCSKSVRRMAFVAHYALPRCVDRLCAGCGPEVEDWPMSEDRVAVPRGGLVKEGAAKERRLGVASDPARVWTLSEDCKSIRKGDGGEPFRISQPNCQEALKFLVQKKAFDQAHGVTKKELCEAVWGNGGKAPDKWPKEHKPIQFFRYSKDKKTATMPFYEDVIGKDEEQGKYFLRSWR